MAYATTKDGVKLFYNDWGSGTPIVLVHGWPLNADMWEYNARVMAEAGHRVIAYDRRGFGRSDKPWTGYDYDTLAADLGAVMDEAGVEGATLVGFSMGGGEVVRYLARGGQRASRAVLAAAVTPFLLRTADNPDGVDRSVFDEMVDGLKRDRPGFLAPFGKQFFGVGLLSSPVSAELLLWSGNLALAASPKATLDCVRSFSETDFRADCAAVKVPTLLIHGDADKTVPIDKSAQRATELIAGSRLEVYEGAPHALVFTEAGRFNKDVLAFAQ